MLLVKLQCCLTAWQSGLAGYIPLSPSWVPKRALRLPCPIPCPSQLCQAATALQPGDPSGMRELKSSRRLGVLPKDPHFFSLQKLMLMEIFLFLPPLQ